MIAENKVELRFFTMGLKEREYRLESTPLIRLQTARFGCSSTSESCLEPIYVLVAVFFRTHLVYRDCALGSLI
jgi:hypothetical protein